MKSKILVTMLGGLLVFSACKKDNGPNLDELLTEALEIASQTGNLDFFLQPASNDYAAIPQDPNNPITADKVLLGSMLYHETALAMNPMHDQGEGTYSCASCHFASAGFQANRHQAIADGGSGFGANGEGRVPHSDYDFSEMDVQPIRTPSAMLGAYQECLLWNGQFGATGPNVGTSAQWTPGTPKETNNLGYEGLEIQAIAGLDVHRMVIDKDWLEIRNYKTLFDDAFPEISEPERYTREYAGLAIAAYERTLMPNQAPWQRWLAGNKKAMSDDQKRGAIVFFEKANCVSCHTGPALNSMAFYALGMSDLFENQEATYGADADSDANLGRYSFTQVDADKYKFKVPQLYNLVDSKFFGHGASFTSIRDVLEYKNAAQKENTVVPDSQLSPEFVPLELTSEEIDDLTTFLAEALRDPNLERYEPLGILSGNCFPNNDAQSRVDLGCE